MQVCWWYDLVKKCLSIYSRCRGVVPVGARNAMAPTDFGRSVNPISTRVGRLSPPNNTGTPGFSNQFLQPWDAYLVLNLHKKSWAVSNLRWSTGYLMVDFFFRLFSYSTGSRPGYKYALGQYCGHWNFGSSLWPMVFTCIA